MDENIKTLLQTHGLKSTQIRLAVLELFDSKHDPLDVKTIKDHIDARGVPNNLASIYRCLNTFLEKGILYRIELGEGKYRYELASLPHHHHLVCNNCNTVEDIQLDEQVLIASLSKKSSFSVDHHHLEFFGTCVDCQ